MQQAIYVSAATQPFTNPELALLLSQSRENNARKNVTGMLFYYFDSFLQVLEGPDENVNNMLKHIANDPLHKQVKVLSSKQVSEKMFGQWTMGFLKAEYVGQMVNEYVDPKSNTRY